GAHLTHLQGVPPGRANGADHKRRIPDPGMSSLPPSPHRSRLRLLVALGVVALGGYFGGTAAWYEWHFRSAVRAERDRDFAVAQRELDACLRHRPDDPHARLLAARLGWRARVDELVPAAGWDVPLRKH